MIMENAKKLLQSFSLLHLAVELAVRTIQTNELKIVELLLSHESIRQMINDINPIGTTAIIRAAETGYIELVKLLLEAGAAVNQKIKNDITALHMAAANGHAGAVKELIKAGANIDAIESDNDRTALYFAAENGHVEVVEILLEADADISLEDDTHAFTPLHIAAKKGHVVIVNSLLKKLNTYEDIQQWAMLNQWSFDRMTPLFLAAQHGHLAIVEALIQADADINKADSYDCTPLFMALKRQHTAVAELLIKHQANVHLKAQNDQSPLSLAIQINQVKIVELLLSVGAGLYDEIAELPKGTHTAGAVVIGLKVNGKSVTRKMPGWEQAITSVKELQDALKNNAEINAKALMKVCNYLLEHRPRIKKTISAIQDCLLLQASKKSLLERCLFELSQPKHNELRAEIYTRKRKLPNDLVEKIEEVDVEPMPKKLRII